MHRCRGQLISNLEVHTSRFDIQTCVVKQIYVLLKILMDCPEKWDIIHIANMNTACVK